MILVHGQISLILLQLGLVVAGIAAAFERNAGFRMDFLLLNPSVFPKLAAAGVDTEFRGREKASDHAPTWIDITLRE